MLNHMKYGQQIVISSANSHTMYSLEALVLGRIKLWQLTTLFEYLHDCCLLACDSDLIKHTFRIRVESAKRIILLKAVINCTRPKCSCIIVKIKHLFWSGENKKNAPKKEKKRKNKRYHQKSFFTNREKKKGKTNRWPFISNSWWHTAGSRHYVGYEQ